MVPLITPPILRKAVGGCRTRAPVERIEAWELGVVLAREPVHGKRSKTSRDKCEHFSGRPEIVRIPDLAQIIRPFILLPR